MLAAHGEAAGGPRVRRLRQRLGVRDRARARAARARRGGRGPGVRRAPHDVGRGQRVDDPGRATPGWPSGPGTRCSPSCCAGSCGRRAATSPTTPARPSGGSTGTAGSSASCAGALTHLWRPVGAGRDARRPRSGSSSTPCSADGTGGTPRHGSTQRVARLPGLDGLACSWTAPSTATAPRPAGPRPPDRGCARRRRRHRWWSAGRRAQREHGHVVGRLVVDEARAPRPR